MRENLEARRKETQFHADSMTEGARIALESLPCPVTLQTGPELCHEATRCDRCRALAELGEVQR